ncbi:OmpH family outer membrane protein [Flavobacterium sp. F-380]|uniref:OmpH family outer membrane protein n=1 Tax=Flavobacterium kayseriense TaxID=2764714 RepID=A0ABR7J4E5_9FLAO|nr:OmpH family outer membrane protein [Flavobacterium kayseriense]MBC5840082.1 OmpH family outer membrane protein [Flavobacterium kayseriense]MBC5847248.1 OmpH family outer membrane protein [Flavobacterium kayseriense]MBU0941809.1 OmpH family outer membrane protein [Bacteroidota bacterium]
MRKQFLFLFLAAITVNLLHSQARGTRVGYIDMEYILQNVPNYTEASIQLESKAQKWKQDIESKKVEINKIKDALKAEKALLTKGLIEERETEIKYLEDEMLDFQQKRFGANGDLINQKALLVKPIQDQVFTVVQDIAESRKYDFIFDKSSDLTMLFAATQFDISDQVLRVLNRTEKREQLTKKQQADLDAKEKKEDAIDANPQLADRQKALDEKKAARDKIIEERRLEQEAKKKAFDDRRQKILDDRAAKKNGTVSANTTSGDTTEASKAVNTEKDNARIAAEEAQKKQADLRAKLLEDKKKVLEDRRKAVEDRRLQILQQRDSIKKAKEEKLPIKQ